MSRRPAYRPLRVAAVVVALVLTTAGPASADSGTDQITGTGQTSSTITVPWTQGLLGSDNKPLPTQRDPKSPLSFLYPDFQNLQITVSQTQNLVHQAISVNWTGLSTSGTDGGFLQLMQCYGDQNTGPSPENCEFGTREDLLPSGLANASAGSRGGPICVANAKPSTTSPPSSLDGSGASAGCDTNEPVDKSHLDPSPLDSHNSFSVPFVPVGTDTKVYPADLRGSFDQFSTNEVKRATTSSDGTGQNFFQVLTSTEAPGLGCGDFEINGSTRDCWLVIVPRGQFDANGYQLKPGNPLIADPAGSPLGASLWAQRIQIHLGFAPIGATCPLGSAKERDIVGTELMSHAVFSWLQTLNTNANCKSLFAFLQGTESTSTRVLSNAVSGDGLAFTNIPIGTEALRQGDVPIDPGPMVYAPVATSAITFGFNINLPSTGGYWPNSVKLTPRLMAKELTQSYRYDLTDFFPSESKLGPDWAKNNPNTITQDPEFKALNPQIIDGGAGTSLAPLLTQDQSAVNQQVWQWIRSDPSAMAWLGGADDGHGMVINPAYQALQLNGPAASDQYTRADPTCFDTGATGEPAAGRCSSQLLPYVGSLTDGAAHVRAANDPLGQGWDPGATSAEHPNGWWGTGTIETPGTTFMSTITDSADLASFGLVPAQLCSPDGTNCVSPSVDSISAAVAGAKPDSAGLLHVNPAAPGPGAYPLVDVTYAAVPTTQAPDALNAFATLIDYAAGPGQTPGVDPGQLPRGYLPLPDSLRAQATAASATLRADAIATPSNPTPPADNGTPQVASSPQGNTASPPGVPAAAAPPTTSVRPGPSTGKNTKLAARVTPNDAAGAMRWVLLTVLIAGVVGAVGGGLLRSPNALGKLPVLWRLLGLARLFALVRQFADGLRP